MKTMNEKVTMVTGAAAGIGLVSAEAFAKAGATVVLVDINEPKEQAEKLVSEGYKAVAYRCDVSDTRAVKEMIDWIVATYGRLDAALNNAGIQTPQRPMAEITDEEFDRTVAVDLKGVWNCMRYEIIQMLKQGGGAIVIHRQEHACGRRDRIYGTRSRQCPAGSYQKSESRSGRRVEIDVVTRLRKQNRID